MNKIKAYQHLNFFFKSSYLLLLKILRRSDIPLRIFRGDEVEAISSIQQPATHSNSPVQSAQAEKCVMAARSEKGRGNVKNISDILK